MQTVLELPQTENFSVKNLRSNKRAILSAIEDCVHAVFFDVSWKTYNEIIEETPERRNPKIFYDQGTLEIMPKSLGHETPIFVIYSIIELIGEEIDMETFAVGQITLTRADLERGCEPDNSIYFGEKVKDVRGADEIDLEFQPAPDLAIEIDITSPSLNKFSVFAKIGISELWIFEDKAIKFFKLTATEYAETDKSLVLKGLTSEVLTNFTAESRQLEKREWREKVRTWARENLKK